MRRLTLEFDVEELLAVQPVQLSGQGQDTTVMRELEYFEILHILKQDRTEMAMIAKAVTARQENEPQESLRRRVNGIPAPRD